MKPSVRGFTLIELIVGIAIIAILATISAIIYRSVTAGVRDAKRKNDLNSILQVYEVKYPSQSFYQPLMGTDFASGAIPKTPEGNNYTCLIGPESTCLTQATNRVAYCVSLGDNQSAPCYLSSDTCFCSSSTQGSAPTSGGGQGAMGGGPGQCDPYGILNYGLAGYWRMNEATYSGVAGEVTDFSGNNHPGQTFGGTLAVAGKLGFGNAAQFDGVNDYIQVNATAPLILDGSNESVFLWVKHNASTSIIFENTWRRRHYSTNWQIIDTTSTYRNGNTTGSADNQWHMIGYTIANGNTFSSFRDNIRVESKSTANLIPSGNYWWFGRICSGSDCLQYFTGLIDEVRIYNRALSTQEVNMLYNGGNGCFP